MIDNVNLIISKDVKEVLNDASLTQMLKSCYSSLYNKTAKGCQDSLRNYYRQLQIDGIMKAQMLEDAKNRTCKPNWKGLIYVTSIYTHINPDLLSDEMAEFYLINGVLKESQFDILPKGYIEKKLEKNSSKAENPVIEKDEKVLNVVKKVEHIKKGNKRK